MYSFLFDENTPHILISVLVSLGHYVTTVQASGLSAYPDESVFEAAQRLRLTILTLDLDFSDLRDFPLGNHYGIVLLRLKNMKPPEMAVRLRLAFENEIRGDLYGRLIIVPVGDVREPPAPGSVH